MLIKDMFVKPIDRDIRGVVQVQQDDAYIIKQELEEYVVTNELQRHFRDFFSSYKRGINGKTDKVGVWISGFFGSGKSHFLKMLSYLLENKVIGGRESLSFFIDEEKIKDPMVVADMKLAASIPTDVILFNIDFKSETSGIKHKDTILNVFLKVFNEHLGYSDNPHVADLERLLDEEDLYEKYKEKYKEINKKEWIKERNKFNFFTNKVVNTLTEINFMDRESAKNWADRTKSSYEISVENFCKKVNDYIVSKGKNHNIVFLVDEVGQYIGDDTDLMLNLQTITEELGNLSKGKAWIVVTSQQDIDSITEVKGRDFSKIQGRFDTRISLTSANVDEVIKLRILDKTKTAIDTLSVLFENNETIIKNLIIFNDGIDKKLYENKKDFAEVYPFIPYQFNIASNVLTSVRKHSSSGKHLAEGERSMLALFKESAEEIKDREDGAIVPFNTFYEALHKWLDSTHSVVISRALDSNSINKNNDPNNFNVNVLKVLFMIKYVKEIEANLDNITTLMVSNINEDRRVLRDNVENALKILESQMLVQRNGDIYIFLTDEEQEINREIKNQDIQTKDVIGRLSDIIYADLFYEEKINIPDFGNKYSFGFNRYVDDIPYKGSHSFDIGVKIITPYSEINGEDTSLRMQSNQGSDVYVDLPNDVEFLKELQLSMKIEKFLSSSRVESFSKFEEIKNIKRREMREHSERGKLFLKEALKQSDFYINGDIFKLTSNDFSLNTKNSLLRLVDTVYHKLNYITQPMDESDINSLFTDDKNKEISLLEKNIPNQNATSEVLNYIILQTKNHSQISLKALINRFNKAPFGYSDNDIQWIIAHLFKYGKLDIFLHGAKISIYEEKRETLVNYFTKKFNTERLLIEIKDVPPTHLVKSIKLVVKEMFKLNITKDDTDAIVKDFKDLTQNMINELDIKLKDYIPKYKFPGKNVIENGIKLIQPILSMKSSRDVLEYIHKNEDNYLDFLDDYNPIKSFFEGEQYRIWKETQKLLNIYEDSKSFIINEDIKYIVRDMKDILNMASPFNNIRKLPELNEKFRSIYNEIFTEKLEPVKKVIKESKKTIIDLLAEHNLEEALLPGFRLKFHDLIKKAESSKNIANLNVYDVEAETLRNRYIKDIQEEIKIKIEIEKKRKEERKRKEKRTGKSSEATEIEVPIKNFEFVSINDIYNSTTWRIENKRDLDKYIEELKESLEKEIKENTVLNIKF